jgi:D-arabinose 1-dehydrogenase-like Zn-dependent alcohol dehydrogenase
MKAWRLERLGGSLELKDVPMPEPRPGSVLVRIEASALMSYLKPYVAGKLPIYKPPPGPFKPGTNRVGVVAAVGRRQSRAYRHGAIANRIQTGYPRFRRHCERSEAIHLQAMSSCRRWIASSRCALLAMTSWPGESTC